MVKGFIIDPTYRIVGDKAFVMLFGKLENGESFVTINEFKPYFYIRKDDLDKAKKTKDEFDVEEIKFKNFDNEEVVKIIVNTPADVPKLRDKFKDKKIECYEADIRFPYRFLIDNEIHGCVEIKGDYESNDQVDRVFKDPEIKPTSYNPKLNVLSFDIETDLTGETIFCISIYTEKFKKVFIISNKKLKNAENCKDEEELLEKFKEKVIELDPDVITGWNFIDFDFNVLQKKFRQYRIPFVLGRDNSNVRLRITQGFMSDSKAEVVGRAVLDGMHLLRNSFISIADHKLETAGQKYLGLGKLLTGENRCYEINDLFKKDQQKLVDYNLRDAELVYKILESSKILELTIKRSMITGLPLDRVSGSIAAFDFLYIKEARNRKIVCPSGKFEERGTRTLGGYVKEPVPGIYDYICVLDFKSLYPSMMRTFNIDPYSFVDNCKGKDLIKAPNGACFKNQDGILPSLLKKIWEERDIARKKKDELTRYALKIQLNSMYGVLASPNCRFYNTKIANAITHFGHHLLKFTHKLIEEKGYKVIYGDTDSNFVVSNAKNLKEAEKIGEELQNFVNEYYKKHIKKEYNRESVLELEFEKCYSTFFMPKLRNGEGGAKKRYAGLLKDDKIEFVGLEIKRGDWTDVAKKFQYELFDKVFHKQEVHKFIRDFVQKLRAGKFDKDLVYKKQIRKELKDYTMLPPHVKAAKKMQNIESNLIEYIITTDGPEPIENIKHKIDYEHYVKKQIKPLADSVLVFFNTSFDDMMKESKQNKLFDY